MSFMSYSRNKMHLELLNMSTAFNTISCTILIEHFKDIGM